MPIATPPMTTLAMFALPANTALVLASGSPRRSMLLAQAGLEFEVRRPDIDETALVGELPTDYVARLSAQKASAVAHPGEIVVAADTTVEIDQMILEKPTDDNDARRMLRMLSGRIHHVHTGVTVIGPKRSVTDVVTTAVTFVELTNQVIDWYVGTGEPRDKAGAYAIQERGGSLVKSVDGSVTNVIGLPLVETLATLGLLVA